MSDINYINQWDPSNVILNDPNVDYSWKICVLQETYFAGNEIDNSSGGRISSIFVIFFLSTGFTIFPILSRTFKWIKMPLYLYLFARYFGTGVIVATAFMHLMDPAYTQIGPNSCVGVSGNWAEFPWVPAIMMISLFTIFLTDVISDVLVERRYGGDGESHSCASDETMKAICSGYDDDDDHFNDEEHNHFLKKGSQVGFSTELTDFNSAADDSTLTVKAERGFRSQIAAFLILEFGILFHSVMIGLNLGAVNGNEFKTLYVVLVFHQSFEGLGIGARLSSIPWPENVSFVWAYLMCLLYGLVTPLSIAIGIGIRASYVSNPYRVNVISGVLDTISCGILIYSGLVELLARDFIFNPQSRKNLKLLTFNISSTMVGAATMAIIGKWA